MAWKKTLVACIFGLTLLGCETLRTVPLCMIDWENQVAHCAEGDNSFDKPLSELNGWVATDETSWRKIADKLEECDRDE